MTQVPAGHAQKHLAEVLLKSKTTSVWAAGSNEASSHILSWVRRQSSRVGMWVTLFLNNR